MGVRAELLSKAEHAELLEEMSHMASELIKIAERERSGINDGGPGLAHGAAAGLSALVAIKPGRDSTQIYVVS